MSEQNFYTAYAEHSFDGSNPARLVTALYQGAIRACKQAIDCLETKDIMGRSSAINKLVSILTELMLSLDHKNGGEISANLKRLYSYMQVRALRAHTDQSAAPLEEVCRLLTDMIEAWYKVAEERGVDAGLGELLVEIRPEPETASVAYGGYGSEPAGSMLGTVFSF